MDGSERGGRVDVIINTRSKVGRSCDYTSATRDGGRCDGGGRACCWGQTDAKAETFVIEKEIRGQRAGGLVLCMLASMVITGYEL